jgi:hypothetical protein
MRISFIFFVCFLSWYTDTFAQGPVYQWATRLGNANNDRPEGFDLDVVGNLYTSGVANNSWYIRKFNPSGATTWSILAYAQDIEVDQASNIYAFGLFSGTIDADPGPGVLSFTSVAGNDLIVYKFDTNGSLKWAKQISGSSTERAEKMERDNNGNLYLTGSYRGILDVDPGSAVNNFTATGTQGDAFLIKLDSNGIFKWARDFKGSYHTVGYSVEMSPSGHLYMTGTLEDVTDLDPSPGVDSHTTTSTNDHDAFICKLDTIGNFYWAKVISTPGHEVFQGAAFKSNGNILLSGIYTGSIDIDPGAAVLTLTTPTGSDRNFFICELTPSGSLIMATGIGGAGEDWCGHITLNSMDEIYIAGAFTGTTDLVPGPGTFSFSSNGSFDFFISKFSPGGTLKWAKKIGGTGNEAAYDLRLTPNGDIFIYGTFNAVTDFNPDAGVANLTTAGNDDIFLARYCTTPDHPGQISGNSNLCVGYTGIFSVTPQFNVQSFNWSVPSGWTGTSTSASISLVAGSSGNIFVTAVNGCGATGSGSIHIITAPSISVSSSTGTLCAGETVTLQAGGASTYSWNNSMNGGSITFAAEVSSVYIATGTSSTGCTGTASLQVTVDPCTGLAVEKSQDNYNIYPNPTNGILNIYRIDNSNFKIVNILGETVMIVALVEPKTTVDISSLTPGIYFVRNEKSGLSQRIVLLK